MMVLCVYFYLIFGVFFECVVGDFYFVVCVWCGK